MSVQAIYKYLFALSLCCGLSASLTPALAQTDTTQNGDEQEQEPAERKKFPVGHQFTIGADVLYPVLNGMVSNRYSYEGEISYYLKKEYYAVAEGGWGGSEVNYDDLKYTTTNYFARLGFNKSILYREGSHDWDMMFVGFRAAMANVSRGSANYIVTDSLWGSQTGISPAKSFTPLWAEINLGIRVELVRGLMAGWNIRGKFMMNSKSFKDLAPLNIAGFGRGDKNAAFDFNIYLLYAIRWDRKHTSEVME